MDFRRHLYVDEAIERWAMKVTFSENSKGQEDSNSVVKESKV